MVFALTVGGSHLLLQQPFNTEFASDLDKNKICTQFAGMDGRQ